jgi:type I restriction enzyme S subunit
MNAALLLEHYARIADAPDAIGRLRRFVLDLAVRSKLVGQDEGDEPAGELLKRIAAEKARLVRTGEARKPKAIPDFAEPPYPLPDNWRWSQIAEIGIINPRVAADDNALASFVPMPLIAAEYGVPNGHEPRPWGQIKKGYTHFAEGDVGLAKITPCFENGKSTVFSKLTGGMGSGTTELHVVRPLFVDPAYILVFWKCPFFIENGIPRMTGTAGQKRVPTDYFANSPFPLPPLAEQHRIVAKVDELMALCDQLETARAEREAARDTFTLSTLAKLNTPDPETFVPDARFALANLAPLTNRVDQIKQLRQTILRLALAGKLTEQEPADDPASNLLATIDARRSALLKSDYPNASEARTQLRKVTEQSLPSELPDLPHGWKYATLQQCALMVIDCKNKTAPYTQDGVRLIRTTNVRDGKLNAIDQRYVSPETYEIWSARAKPEPGDILITREAPMGEVCLIPTDTTICLGQRMMLARLVPDTISPRFMLYSLMDPDLMDRVQDKPIGMTVQHLRVGGVETLLVPLPPLAEQHRIVAKVDKIMELCETLEASLVAGEETRSKLLKAVLANSLEPA